MQWTDEGIVLGVKRHGEASAILELMTRAHGRHLGLVRGGFGSRLKPILQPGNTVAATWRARLDEHLGTYTVEGLRLRAGGFFGASHAVYGVTHLAALMRLLPERDPHQNLHDGLAAILDRLDEPQWAAPMAVRFGPVTDSSAGQTYTVKSGDSLTKISGQFGGSIKALRSANSLKTDKIVVGQKLKIPAKSSGSNLTATNSATPTSMPTGQ